MNFQMSAARTAGNLLASLLVPEWRTETNSLILAETIESSGNSDPSTAPPLSEKHYIRSAEEFVCLPYLGFVQNILGRMRSIVMSILCLFVATAIAIASYPFDPRQGLSAVILALFIVLGGTIFYVYAQMHRDATLSHVTNTTPGELGADFWLKIVSFGIAPLLAARGRTTENAQAVTRRAAPERGCQPQASRAIGLPGDENPRHPA
jgi:hypothetical protein